MVRYITYAEADRRAERYLARLGLPKSVARYDARHYLKPKKTRKSMPLSGRRGHRASKPRRAGSAKRTGN